MYHVTNAFCFSVGLRNIDICHTFLTFLKCNNVSKYMQESNRFFFKINLSFLFIKAISPISAEIPPY